MTQCFQKRILADLCEPRSAGAKIMTWYYILMDPKPTQKATARIYGPNFRFNAHTSFVIHITVFPLGLPADESEKSL